MALFLPRSTLYRVIQRELPEDVYPDSGRPGDFWSTAESDAQAAIIAGVYEAQETNYDNFWASTADDAGLDLLEQAHFGRLSTGLDSDQRKLRLNRKTQEMPSLSADDLEKLVKRELPPYVPVEYVAWNRDMGGGSWYLGVSELGVDTILGGSGSHSYPLGTDLCLKDGSDIGLSPERWTEYRDNAYTYEMRILGYEPTAAELEEIERVLTESEAARDKRIILTSAEPANPYLPVMEDS